MALSIDTQDLVNYPGNVKRVSVDHSVIVPVGEDQVPHLEFTREIARRFNATFGETFPEPAEVLGTED